jgi:hypothetical protein
MWYGKVQIALIRSSYRCARLLIDVPGSKKVSEQGRKPRTEKPRAQLVGTLTGFFRIHQNIQAGPVCEDYIAAGLCHS